MNDQQNPQNEDLTTRIRRGLLMLGDQDANESVRPCEQPTLFSDLDDREKAFLDKYLDWTPNGPRVNLNNTGLFDRVRRAMMGDVDTRELEGASDDE